MLKVRQRRSRIACIQRMDKVCLISLGHWTLTNSRPSANVTLIILRVADFAAALLDDLFEHREDIPA
jgi:hypothetical protein